MARTKAKKKGAGAKAEKEAAAVSGGVIPAEPEGHPVTIADSGGEYLSGVEVESASDAPPLDPTAGMGDPSTRAEGEDLSDLEPALREAIIGFDLKRDDVLAHRIRPEGGVVLVTRGGRKVAWPDDRARVLTPEEKGVQTKGAPRFWPEGFLEKGPPKRG